jgi:hypothetical protein
MHVVTEMQISETFRLPIAEVLPPRANARKHAEDQLEQLVASIRDFGFVVPVILDETGTILAGHGRWLAARKLGLETVPCIRISGLTESQKVAFALADNRIALNSEWNEKLLADQVAALLADPDFGQHALRDYGFGRDDLLRLDMLVESELAAETPDPVPGASSGDAAGGSIWDPGDPDDEQGLPLPPLDAADPAVPYTVFLQQPDYDELLVGIAEIKRLKGFRDSASALVFALTETAARLNKEVA